MSLKISPLRTPAIEVEVERQLPDVRTIINEIEASGTVEAHPVGGGDGTDANAIHKNTSGEIASITEKTAPVGDDLVIIEDSAASNAKKRAKLSNASPNAVHTDKSSEINALTEKTSPVANDLVIIEDSASSNAKKKVKLSNASPNAIHTDVTGEINGLTEKTTPAGNDLFVIEDSAASNAKKKVKQSNIVQASATSRIFGRKTAGAGPLEELTLSEALDLIGSAAQGDILYRGSSTWARLAAGSNGQFLKTQGASANPAWASIASGGSSVADEVFQTEDDGFDSSSLDAKWAQTTTGTAPTVVINDPVARSIYWAKFGAADGSVRIQESFSPAGDFSLTGKFSLNGTASFQGADLRAVNSGVTAGLRVVAFRDTINGQVTLRLSSYDGVTTHSSTSGTLDNSKTIMLHLKRVGSVWTGFYNLGDNLIEGWIQIGTSTRTETVTVAKIDMSLFQSGATVKQAIGCHWIRRDFITVNVLSAPTAIVE